MNRLEHSLNNSEVFSASIADANGRLQDTDYAKEMTEFAKSQIVNKLVWLCFLKPMQYQTKFYSCSIILRGLWYL